MCGMGGGGWGGSGLSWCVSFILYLRACVRWEVYRGALLIWWIRFFFCACCEWCTDGNIGIAGRWVGVAVATSLLAVCALLALSSVDDGSELDGAGQVCHLFAGLSGNATVLIYIFFAGVKDGTLGPAPKGYAGVGLKQDSGV